MPNRYALLRNFSALVIAPLALLALFQNCSGGFDGAVKGALENTSQCVASIQAKAAQLPIDKTLLNCGKLQSYSCDRRIFSPNVSDLTQTDQKCFADQGCVEVMIHQFSTAKVTASIEEFAPGGEFNREEVRCHHHTLYSGVSIVVGDGETIDEALEQSIKACQKIEAGS